MCASRSQPRAASSDSSPAGPEEAFAALPDGFGIRLDTSTIARSGGRAIVGGSPRRLLRLSAPAARALQRWTSGEQRPQTVAERRLARTLVDAGAAHPLPVGGPRPGEVTIVIPVRDRPAQLARCLSALADGVEVVVIDDGSRDPDPIAAAAAGHARVVRRETSQGPAAARNLGLRLAGTDIVVFVDSDCVPAPGWLERMLPHFADPRVAAVAPRIVPLRARGGNWLERYEAARSPLDLGPAPGLVAPHSRIGYVPTAALAVRRSAAGSGFAADMPVGEDVDFVWHLHFAGWDVRYEPAARVAHDHRATVRSWSQRRLEYGLSAGPLAVRHPRHLAPAIVSSWSAAAWILFALGRRRQAALPVLLGLWRARRLMAWIPDSEGLTLTMVASGILAAGRSLAGAITRAWLPLTLIAGARSSATRNRIAVGWLLSTVGEWRGRDCDLDPARYVVARLLDDASNCAGLWLGCWRERTVDPLLPRLARAGPAMTRARGPAGDRSRG